MEDVLIGLGDHAREEQAVGRAFAERQSLLEGIVLERLFAELGVLQPQGFDRGGQGLAVAAVLGEETGHGAVHRGTGGVRRRGGPQDEARERVGDGPEDADGSEHQQRDGHDGGDADA